MLDWNLILDDLNAMDSYFEKCAQSAAPDSTARKRFDGYRQTLKWVADAIREQIGEEDDGK